MIEEAQTFKYGLQRYFSSHVHFKDLERFSFPAEALTECMLNKRLQTLTGLQDWGAIGQLQCSQISSRFSIHSPSE